MNPCPLPNVSPPWGSGFAWPFGAGRFSSHHALSSPATRAASFSIAVAIRASKARSASAAQALSVFIDHLSDASLRQQAGAFGLAPEGLSAPVGAHQKGEQLLGFDAFTFACPRLVTQPVTSLNFSRGQPWMNTPCSANFRCSRAWKDRPSCRPN